MANANRLVSATDPLNNTTAYAYTLGGLIDKITDALGGVLDFTYDLAGNLIGVTDELFRTTSYSYNSLGLLAAVTDDQSNVTSFAYDAVGNLTGVTDALGNLTTYGYDILGRNTSLTDAHYNTTTFQYDAAGQLLSVTDPLYLSTSYAYNELGLLDSVTDALGNVTTYAYDELGNVASVTLPQSSTGVSPVYSYAYDLLGRLVSETDPLGGQLSYAYDAAGNLLTSTDQLNRTTAYAYDNLHRLTSITDALSNVTQYGYDAAGNLTSITDALNNTTTYTYDALSRNTSITDALGGVVAFAYDAAGQLTGQTDQLGNATAYGYDTLGQLTSITDALSNVTSYAYDAVGNLLSTTDALSNTTTYEYDGLHRNTSITDALGGVLTFGFDSAGQLTSQTDQLGNTTSYGYDSVGQPISVTDALGNVTAYSFDALGNLLTVTDALNNTTTYGYDELSRTTTITDALNGVVSYAYDAASQRIAQTDQLNRSTSFAYDDLGRLSGVTDPAGGVTGYAYDALGNLTAFTDALGNQTTYAYDALGRTTSITDALGGVSSLAYDVAGNLTSETNALGQATSYGYDVLGQLTTVTDSLGNATSRAYDAVGNLTNVTDPLSQTTSYAYDELHRLTAETNANGGVVAYAYDAASNMLSLTDPGDNTTSWTYDALHRAIQETNELGYSRYFQFDAVGNLTERTDRNGRIREFDYDALNRLTEERWIENSTTVNTINLTFDAASQLTAASDAVSSYTYQYNDLGLITQVDNFGTSVGPHAVLDYTFDALGNQASLVATINGVGDFQNNYTYDALSRMTSVQQTTVGHASSLPLTDKRVDFSYNALGQFTSIDRYADLAASELVVSSDYTYDSASRLTALDHAQGATPLAAYAWTFDDLGRITQATSPDGTSDYTYDATGQLTGATNSFAANENYSYDENGNRTTVATGSLPVDYVVGPNNQILSDGTHDYEYDAEGNRTKETNIATGEVTEYEYDHRNRLTRITDRSSDGGPITKQVDYTYDLFGRRLAKHIDNDGDGTVDEKQFYIYDGQRHERGNAGDHIILAFNESGELTNRYLHGPAVDQILADEQLVNELVDEVLYPLTDQLGSVRDLASYDESTGDTTVVNHIIYDSFGQMLSETDPTIDHIFAYTGRERDQESNLQYNRARYYHLRTATWMSVDPLGFAAGDTNLGRYVGNDSVNATDPSGLQDKIVGFREVNFDGEIYVVAMFQDSDGTFYMRTQNGKLEVAPPDVVEILLTEEEVQAAKEAKKEDSTLIRKRPNEKKGLLAPNEGHIGFKKTIQGNVGSPHVTHLQTPLVDYSSDGPSGGEGSKFQGIPKGHLVGTGGTGDCIGLIIVGPKGKDLDSRTVYVYHFTAQDSPAATLERDGPFPAGSKAILFGGIGTDAISMGTLQSTKRYLDNHSDDITLDGYYNSPGLWVDRYGNYHVRPAERRGAARDGSFPAPDTQD